MGLVVRLAMALRIDVVLDRVMVATGQARSWEASLTPQWMRRWLVVRLERRE